jgi:hypothetical protein
MMVVAINECFVANGIRKEGDKFDYNGPPNRHLKPLDDAPWPAEHEQVKATSVQPKPVKPDKSPMAAKEEPRKTRGRKPNEPSGFFG